MTILQDIYQLKPNNLVTLYELDLSPCIGRYGATTQEKYYWCDGVNDLGNDIVWNGITYSRYPIQASGFDKQGNGSIPRPKLVAGNYGGIIGDLAREYNDIIGAKVTRIRTFAKYLDPINFEPQNYYTKSNDFSDSSWQKDNITVTKTSNIIPFPVGSKISIQNVIPSAYNFGNLVVTSCTTTSVTVSLTATVSQIQSGTISGSGYTVNTVEVSGTGSAATITFLPIDSDKVTESDSIYAITEANTNTKHSLNKLNYITYKANTTYCKSFYIRKGIRNQIKIGFPGYIYADGIARYAYIDLSTKGYFKSNTIKGNVQIEEVPNSRGWYRCSVADTAEVNVSALSDDLVLCHQGEEVYPGDSSNYAVLITSPQISTKSLFPVEYYAEVNNYLNTNPYADTTQYLDKEIWTIDRKSNENSVFVEWELTAPYDLMGVRIPRRQCIQNVCSWKYRSSECGYTGTAYFNIKDEQVGSPTQDLCGKRVSSCKLRFPGGQALPYGGFPSIGIY